jgi:hypothetical protein
MVNLASKSGRALMPSHLERSRVFSIIENAMRLSDYDYTVDLEKQSIVVIIGDEKLEINIHG